MNNESNTKNQNDIHIEQLYPEDEPNDFEKEVIDKFRTEELSKTKQFILLNSKKNEDENLELPKKSTNLSDTIRLKISELREKIDETLEMPTLKKRKSLYDTVIIKLDELINNRNALKHCTSKKVTKVETTKEVIKKRHLFKPRDLTKLKKFKLNIESEEFGRQLYNLNKIALINLSIHNLTTTRKAPPAIKLDRIEKINISKDSYLKYQKKLTKFAINKLYYKFAPKETKKYRIYKYSVILSSLIFLTTSLIILNWFIQGISINNLSNSLKEDTPIVSVPNEGILFNQISPNEEEHEENNNSSEEIEEPKTSLYWKYLHTPLSSVDFTELLKENKDTIGWLIVNNTNINYPVVQTTNNDYYLKHAFNKTYNSAGWVFADFRDNFDILGKNTVIYGHGRKDKVMFGSLNDVLNTKWYQKEDNQIIQFSTIKYNTMWQIFSIYKVPAESYYITTDFNSDKSYQKFIDTMIDRSFYNFNVEVNTNDKLLTLSTCYDSNGMRTVVQAKLVKIQER